MPIENILKLLALCMLCGVVTYILYVLIMWFIALGQIGAWVFTLAAGG